MRHFNVIISETANEDIKQLSYTIKFQYKAPVTSFKYVQGLIDEIKRLSRSAESYSIQTRKSLQQYGPYPRRVNYKKMAIIYNVINDVVYIRRVIPANTISGL
jgi:hypothetical protein